MAVGVEQSTLICNAMQPFIHPLSVSSNGSESKQIGHFGPSSTNVLHLGFKMNTMPDSTLRSRAHRTGSAVTSYGSKGHRIDASGSLLVWMGGLGITTGALLGGGSGRRTLKYSQSRNEVSCSFRSLTAKGQTNGCSARGAGRGRPRAAAP